LFDNDLNSLEASGGNLLSNISNIAGFKKNEDDRYGFGVAFFTISRVKSIMLGIGI
jgi:hypothetical protein